MNEFTQRVITIIQQIPERHIMTYGQIARLAGNSRGARGVSWILHSMSKSHQLPWHRVVNAKGKVSHTGSEQRELLELEGVTFGLGDRIDLEAYQWRPPEPMDPGENSL